MKSNALLDGYKGKPSNPQTKNHTCTRQLKTPGAERNNRPAKNSPASEALCQNLLEQAEKLRRHNRQGSYKTRERYFEAFARFLRYTAEVYRLQKLANLSGKHLASYVEYMHARRLAASTIKTDLAAIRFWHDQIPGAKYRLPGNEDFDLERRRFGRVDRGWSMREFNLMIHECWMAGREDYAACVVLARYAGLRLHEVLRIDTAMAHAALKSGMLTIKGKGGKIRRVPINESIGIELRKLLEVTEPGQKLFVPKGKQTHTVKAAFQAFIASCRSRVRDAGSCRTLTFHGLRHTCALEWYRERVAAGCSEQEARLQVSHLLGHERDDVTKVYLAGLNREHSAFQDHLEDEPGSDNHPRDGGGTHE